MNKLVFVALFSPFVSASAFAFPAQSFLLQCQSSKAQVTLSVTHSQADGVDIQDVNFKPSGKSFLVSKYVTDVALNGDEAPRQIAFFNNGQLVSLQLKSDLITAALEKSKAVLTINGQAAPAVCTGTQEY